MALLGEILDPPVDYRRTTLSTLAWWQARRGTYNLIVDAAGIITVVAVRLIALIPPQMSFQWDWRPIAVYGLLANVCYTFGWGTEVALRKLMGDRAPNIGPALFRQGLAFSVGLTLLPILTVSFFWVVRAGAWFFR